MKKNIIIVGANSKIAQECIKLWARDKNLNLYLYAKNKNKLDNFLSLNSHKFSCSVKTGFYDAESSDGFGSLNNLLSSIKTISILFICHGYLGENKLNLDNNSSKKIIDLNFTSFVDIIELALPVFKKQKYGSLAVISSVAGDRGRASNFIYGASKAALNAYCSGLRQLLFSYNVKVVTIKPGMVDTPMTQHLQIPKFLLSHPEKVANDIVSGIKNNRSVIYTPFYWHLIMIIIKMIPEFIFKRISRL
jgi:short-subunit dehydrogenase